MPITAAVLGGHGKQVVRLYYRRHARGKFYAVRMKRSRGGTYRATIPSRARDPEGVDYYIRAGRTVEPYGAARGPLYHSIAVALPKVRHRSGSNLCSGPGGGPTWVGRLQRGTVQAPIAWKPPST